MAVATLHSHKEALVPHLETTLQMNWNAPPAILLSLLQQCDAMAPHSFQENDKQFPHIENRCGKDALREIILLAQQKENVSFENFQRVQRLIPEMKTVSFRLHPAYCDVRQERYFHFEGMEKMFSVKISKDGLDEVHPLLKMVRLCLDIIFFHPFNDGNARASILWTVFLCKQNNFPLPDLGSTLRFPFIAGNEKNYWAFASMILQQILSNGKIG